MSDEEERCTSTRAHAHCGDMCRSTVEAKPLHVQVAEALGCEATDRGDGVFCCGCNGRPHGGVPDEHGDRWPIVAYDTDWSATGPLIERLGITLTHDPNGWSAHFDYDAYAATGVVDAWGNDHGFDGGFPTALVAVCNLILALKEAGKLAA